jgi:hypothetical protein
MAQLSSRLVISLVDRVSGPAKGIARSLRMLDGADGSHFIAMGRNARKTGDALRGFGTSAAVAGYGMYSFVNATKPNSATRSPSCPITSRACASI